MTSEGGKLTLVLGPMFAGKTSELSRLVMKNVLAKEDAVIVKNKKDVRYTTDNTLKTHNGHVVKEKELKRGGKLRIVVADGLSDLEISETVVGVDEGQFFPDIVPAVKKWVGSGKTVYVAALNGDYLRNPFKPVSDVLPFATEIIFLKAVCMVCPKKPANDANHTMRVTDDKKIIVVGGSDTYKAVCSECYRKYESKT